VLVRIAACGICGSDVHGYTGGLGRRIPPLVMGHEAAGTVEAVGAGVTDLPIGSRVALDGTLDAGTTFFDATPLVQKRRKGMPDGLKVDRLGNLFATGPGGVLVLSPDGTHLGTLLTGQATANCGFGDDGPTLYITADSHLCRVRLSTEGPIPGR